jgi:hypothetical protein
MMKFAKCLSIATVLSLLLTSCASTQAPTSDAPRSVKNDGFFMGSGVGYGSTGI